MYSTLVYVPLTEEGNATYVVRRGNFTLIDGYNCPVFHINSQTMQMRRVALTIEGRHRTQQLSCPQP